jgi:hypothetical protein
LANVGPIITTEDVLQAVLFTYKLWMPYYLAELEAEHDLKGEDDKPAITRPRSYHGGVDDESWIGEVLPEVMIVVSPLGEPERPEYAQWYLIDAKVACKGDQVNARAEDEARVQASYLGGALMLLVQQPSLGGLAQDLTMTSSPTLSFLSSERYVVQASARFQVRTGSIITQEGPRGTVPQTPEEGGGEQLGPPGAPTYVAESAHITVERKA